ncbi:g2074 [Coccomyxa viridis]|uniref:G2074 protein n=1 Tax=Coccomyxa viridis TaxID=1274662 RepID=A0ABP1FJH8_9CHLO
MQSAPPGEAQQWAQQQQAYKDSVRTSTPATIQNALQNFNGVQMNPSKLYAPGAPTSNNAPLTPEQQPQVQQQAQPVATPQALGPATVVYGKGPNGYVKGSAPVGSQVYLPAQAAQSSAQAVSPASGLSQASYQQASDNSASGSSASQYASSQAATPVAYSGASQAASSQAAAPVAYSGASQAASSQAATPMAYSGASQAGSSQAAAPVAFYGNSQAASSQAAAPVAFYGGSRAASSQAAAPIAYSGASDVDASGADAASPATAVPNSRLKPGVLQRPTSTYDASAAAPDTSTSSDVAAAAPVASSSSYSAAASTTAASDTSASAGAAPVTPAAPATSATGAQSLLSSLGGSLADSPGVAPAPPGANFNWLQPSTKVTQVPTSVVQAMQAKAPRSSPTSQGVRDFVNQAGFQDNSGSAQSTQQAGSAAGTGSQQQQQGRRLAEGPAVSSSPASAQRPGPGQNPSVTARLANAFGPSATALLRVGGTNFLQAAPGSPPASDMIQLLGPAVSDIPDSGVAPAPGPASTTKGRATSIGGEVAGLAHAAATSIESEVATHARAPAVAPSAAAGARGSQLQGPRPPFQDALDAVAGLPGALGLLPRLPGMPGSSASLQAQDGSQVSSGAGQAGAAGPMPLPPGMGRRR